MKRKFMFGLFVFAISALSLLQIGCSNKKTSDKSSANDTILSKISIDTTNLILAVVFENKKAYFIDTTGKIVINKDYENADNFSEGLAAVEIDGKWGYIDVKGNIIIKPQFEQAGNFSEGFACVGKSITIEGQYGPQERYGFIDKTGKIVIDYQFYYSASFYEGLANVASSETGSSFDIYYYFIDNTGKKILSTVNNEKFKQAGKFNNGIAKVETTSGLFLINKKGTITDKTSDMDFSETNNYVDFGIYRDKENNRLVDKDVENKHSVSSDMSSGNIEVERGKWGYKNKNGAWVIQPKYSSVGYFNYTYMNKSTKFNK